MLVNFFFFGKCTATLLLISLQHLPIGKPREINVFFLTERNETMCGKYLVHAYIPHICHFFYTGKIFGE